MVIQEIISIPDSTGTAGRKDEESSSSSGKSSPSPLVVRPYQPFVSYPQRMTWSKLFKFEPRFERFLDILRRIYASVPFLKAFKEAPTYLKFLGEFLAKKEMRDEGITEVP